MVRKLLKRKKEGKTVLSILMFDRRIEEKSDMIYFDNAATTCVFPEVVEAMQDAMQVTYGIHLQNI